MNRRQSPASPQKGAPRRYRPRKAPPAVVAEDREMELIGLAEDGRMYLWDVGMVRPVSAFKTDTSGHIEEGHYVIEWKGHAITVHCGNYVVGSRIPVLFMCNSGPELSLPRAEVEAMLIGKVIPDPILAARISENLRLLLQSVTRNQQNPQRQRGRIGP